VQQLSLTGQRHNDGKLRGGLRFTGFEQFREQQCNECDLAPSRGSAARLFFSCLACCTSQPNHRAEQDHWGCRGGQPKSAGSQPQRLLSRSGGGGTMVPHHSSTGSRTGSRPSFSPLFSITATSRSMEGTASRACALQHRHKHRHYSSMEGIACRAGAFKHSHKHCNYPLDGGHRLSSRSGGGGGVAYPSGGGGGVAYPSGGGGGTFHCHDPCPTGDCRAIKMLPRFRYKKTLPSQHLSYM